MSSVSDNISSTASEIIRLSKSGNFREAYEKYNDVDHPTACYYLGLYAYNDDFEDIAEAKFIQGAKFGFSYPNDYINSLHSNSIGQCIFLLLDKELIHPEDIQKVTKLIGLAYTYLSSSIELIGDRAYQSYETRAKLLSMSEHSLAITSVMDYLGVQDISLPIIISNDYYQSGMGYNNYLFQSSSNPYSEKLIAKGLQIFTNIVYEHFEENIGLDQLNEMASAVHMVANLKAQDLLKFANQLTNKDFYFY